MMTAAVWVAFVGVVSLVFEAASRDPTLTGSQIWHLVAYFVLLFIVAFLATSALNS